MYKHLQDDEIQYDNCNASAGSGRYFFANYCSPMETMETMEIHILLEKPQFFPMMVYFFASEFVTHL